jgi:hypothetical protein
MANKDKRDASEDVSKQGPAGDEPQREAESTVRMITAEDAGWITPTAFVLPIKLVPVDPPRLIKKRPPAG